MCDSATTGLQYIDAWKSACSDLDLIENGSKLQIHCAQPTDDLFMKRSGIPAKALSQGAKVLGAGFGQTSTAEVRGATACALLARISLLPGDAQFRERAYRQRVLPLLNWAHGGRATLRGSLRTGSAEPGAVFRLSMWPTEAFGVFYRDIG